jgi:hypothetical protein
MCIFYNREVMRYALAFGVVALLSMPVVTAAQNQPLAFEVASVKPVASVPTGGQRGTTGVVIGPVYRSSIIIGFGRLTLLCMRW